MLAKEKVLKLINVMPEYFTVDELMEGLMMLQELEEDLAKERKGPWIVKDDADDDESEY